MQGLEVIGAVRHTIVYISLGGKGLNNKIVDCSNIGLLVWPVPPVIFCITQSSSQFCLLNAQNSTGSCRKREPEKRKRHSQNFHSIYTNVTLYWLQFAVLVSLWNLNNRHLYSLPKFCVSFATLHFMRLSLFTFYPFKKFTLRGRIQNIPDWRYENH
jgi:hypothetical protein